MKGGPLGEEAGASCSGRARWKSHHTVTFERDGMVVTFPAYTAAGKDLLKPCDAAKPARQLRLVWILQLLDFF